MLYMHIVYNLYCVYFIFYTFSGVHVLWCACITFCNVILCMFFLGACIMLRLFNRAHILCCAGIVLGMHHTMHVFPCMFNGVHALCCAILFCAYFLVCMYYVVHFFPCGCFMCAYIVLCMCHNMHIFSCMFYGVHALSCACILYAHTHILCMLFPLLVQIGFRASLMLFNMHCNDVLQGGQDP